MKARLLILTGFLIAMTVGCDKEEEAKSLITIDGITEMDITAEQTGNVDATDWNLTDQWTATEENLFKQNNAWHLAATETNAPASPVVVLGYPNPVRVENQEHAITFAFQLGSGMYYDMRIINEKMVVGFHLDSVRYNNIRIGDSSFVSNEMYRIYYKIYADKKVYRGHGDFKIIK